MKRMTLSILIAVTASALYISSPTPAHASAVLSNSEYAQSHFNADKWTRTSDSQTMINRQDFVIMLVDVLKLDGIKSTPASETFKDVPSGHYAFAAIETAVQAGLIQGVGQGRFGLEQPITRQDMAVVFYRALKKLEIDPVQDEDAKTEDITQAAQYAKDAVAYAMKTRLFPDVIETFVPQATVTSEETISVISKWFRTYEQQLHVEGDKPQAGQDQTDTVEPGQREGPIHGVVTPIEITIPSAPDDLLFRYGSGEILLTWTQKYGETYNVYSSLESGTDYILLDGGNDLNAGSFLITDVFQSEETFYVVEAVNSAGKSHFSNEVSNRPHKVSSLQAILNEEEESINLTWSDSQVDVHYNVYYISPDGVHYRLNDEFIGRPEYVIANRNLLSGRSGKYTIYVVALNGLKMISDRSNEIVLHVKKEPEDRLTIMDPSVAEPSDDLDDEPPVITVPGTIVPAQPYQHGEPS
ncbi:hypothetical protein JCM10914A_14900 [Paenibacillus sp. JCM 10914]|uniref:S-layer homology domain-containing protein n=2 Tax=Bacillales TaxID=1385 RepID=UPI0003CC7313|nr:S-layer homology domain-containing protein [Paenibacillus sp. JCM 10914]GAE09145.1 5'-nucleotidase [Paenibacillus sp. JCM 10914]